MLKTDAAPWNGCGCLIAFFLILHLSTVLRADENSSSKDKPNFVWLISEDNSKHYLKWFDEHGVETPHIEQLARNGITFTRAFSNAPVCSVARTTLITGCLAPRIGTQYHRKLQTVPLPDGLKMFPAMLRRAGYYTSNCSKKDYNAKEGPGVWDESSKKASWRNRTPNQPFFHMQSFHQSHEGSLHLSRKQMASNQPKVDPNTVFLQPQHPDTKLFRQTAAYYRDRIGSVDRRIGKVIDQLEQDKLLDTTFVFYFSDHGGVLPGSKGYLYETGLHIPLVVSIPKKYESLIGTNLQRGQRSDRFVSFIDFAPTILNLAGLPPHAEHDGVSFIGPGAAAKPSDKPVSTLGYADRFDEKYDLVRSLRVGNYKYIRNFQPLRIDGLQNNYRYKNLAWQQWRSMFQDGKLDSVKSRFFQRKPVEGLYDLESDPFETENLAASPAFQNQLQQMRSRLTETLKGLPDLGFYPESYLIETAFENPVKFGSERKGEIAKLIDTANLCLQDSDVRAERMIESMQSTENPWIRYWAIQALSVEHESTPAFLKLVRKIAAADVEPLNRAVACEFLAATTNDDLQPLLQDAIQKSRSEAEAAMILNSVVLIRDVFKKPVHVQPDWLAKWKAGKKDNIKRRLQYLSATQ